MSTHHFTEEQIATLNEATAKAQDGVKTPEQLFRNIKKVFEDVLGIEFLKFHITLMYHDILSNSHGCPRNGVTNFVMEEGKPKGYAGYGGNLYFQTTDERFDMALMRKLKWPNDPNAASNIHSGSGSGRGTSGTYAIYFFLDDFPKIRTEVHRGKILQKPITFMNLNKDLVCKDSVEEH